MTVFGRGCCACVGKVVSGVRIMNDDILKLAAVTMALSITIVLFSEGCCVIFSVHSILRGCGFTRYLFVDISDYMVMVVVRVALVGRAVRSLFSLIEFVIFRVIAVCGVITGACILFVVICVVFFRREGRLRVLKRLCQDF